MTQSARRGPYSLQDQSLGANQGSGGPAGPQTVQIAPGTSETHYGPTAISDGTAAPNNNGPLLLDGTTTPTLANRISVEFYNNGSNDVEVSTNSSFTFGKNQGRTIKAGTSWTVGVGPANAGPTIKHYALCGAGNTCSLEIAEVGQ